MGKLQKNGTCEQFAGYGTIFVSVNTKSCAVLVNMLINRGLYE